MRLGVLELAAIVAAAALIVSIVYELAKVTLEARERSEQAASDRRIRRELFAKTLGPRNGPAGYDRTPDDRNGP
jgi:hypothetical protein